MRRFHRPIRAAAFALALALPAASAVPLWADVLGSDADALNGGAQSAITLSATPGQTLTFPVSLFVECQTKNHMSGATTIAYAPAASTVPAGGTLSATPVNIPKPAGWPLDSQNCGAATSTPAETSTVTVGAPITAGTHAYSLRWSSSDGDVDSSPHGKVDITVTVSPPAPVDTTPPVITRTLDGGLGLDGWYTSSVTVGWSVSDPESPIVIDSGCGVQSFTADTAAGSSTCTAHSAGGSATATADFKIDQTGPVSLGAALSRLADHNGWYNHPVDVVFTGTDATSGIASCDTLTYAGPGGSAVSLVGGCTDNAGNAATTSSPAFDYDATAPLVSGAPDRAPDHNGWYNHPVDVVFTGTDATSGIASCDTLTYAGPDGSGLSLTGGCTDNAGNAATTASSAFDYDATAPTLVAGAPDRAPDHNGWFNQPVDVVFTGADSGSGIDICDTVGYSGPDGATRTVNGGCTDAAGNTTTADSSAFDYDATGPFVSGIPTRPADHSGWFNHALDVLFSGIDVTSGIDTCDTVGYGGPDGTERTVNGGCTDLAGNTSNVASAPFNYDATAPLVSGAPDRAPDHNGWFNHALGVAFSGTDATSGIESCDTIAYGGPDGTGITVNGGCTDGAGNTATTGSSAFDYDGTAPSITITSPADGGSYVKGSSVAAAYDCSDALSGVDTCDGTVDDGSAIDTASVGGKVFAVSATDQAGNTASRSHLYNVVFDWLGFLRPIDNLPVVNVVKAGSAVPVKFGLGGNQGLGIFIPGSPSSQKVACDTGSPQDAIETTVTAGGSTLSYDAATGQYTYVWKSDKAWASSCRMLTVTLLDGTTHQAAFKLAK